MTLPRPDLSALGIQYRRIPLLSIGRSVYCDTRLILQKLDAAFPANNHLASTSPEQEALRTLLSAWTIDGGIFTRAAQAIPPEAPALQDPKFTRDRQELTGRSWSNDTIKLLRPEALVHLRAAFDFLENGLLADGREWILKTEKPTLADIEAIWPFHWLTTMRNALPASLISKDTHPKVFAWIKRFNAALAAAKKNVPKPTTLSGEDAAKFITSSSLDSRSQPSSEDQVDENDPACLKKGALVESWPTDTGSRNRDKGRLLKMDKQEVVLENEKGVRIHLPRWNFRIREVTQGEKGRL
ncbi:MAG: hypothetical protein Q9164_004013 [Protoblastenia rupestris]